MSELNNPSPRHPKCLIINEIGVVRATSDDEESKKEAEETLQRLLEDERPEHRVIAFSWLSVIKDPDQQTLRKIKEFEQNPDNEEMLPGAQRLIENYKMLNN